MKKIMVIAPSILSIAFLFFSFCYMVSPLFGYSFVIYQPLLSSAVMTGCLLICTIYRLRHNDCSDVHTGIGSTLLLPCSLFYELFLILHADHSALGVQAVLTLFIGLLGLLLFKKSDHPGTYKTILGILSAVLAVCLLISTGIIALFGDVSVNTVEKTLYSPKHQYVAEIIGNDQGALGGATLVEVTRVDRTLPLLIGEFKPSPKRVYQGRWGEFENMEIYWKDDHTLIIHDVAYAIE